MSAKIIDWKSGVVQTTDAAITQTVCQTDVLPNGSTVTIEGNIQGRDTTSGEVAHAKFEQVAKVVSSTLSLVGSLISIVTMVAGSEAVLSTSVVSLDVSGGTVRMRINGVAGKTIEWFGDMRVRVN